MDSICIVPPGGTLASKEFSDRLIFPIILVANYGIFIAIFPCEVSPFAFAKIALIKGSFLSCNMYNVSTKIT